jgi:tRNA A37 N6-isopentenylltransferase MiaA
MVADDIDAARCLLPPDFTATDPQRVARALEVFFETGHHISEFQNMPRTGAVAPDAFRILICPESNLLRERIAARIPQMISGGAHNEARLIIGSGWDERRAIGAAQLCAYLRGEKSESECVSDWINKTKEYNMTYSKASYKTDKFLRLDSQNSKMGGILDKLTPISIKS